MKTYCGVRDEQDQAVVHVYERHGVEPGEGVSVVPLPPRLDLREHSPTGFEWGYGGSGPAQLALALLADHLRDDTRALQLYQAFKRTVIAALPYHGWSLTSQEIDQALARLEEVEVW